MPAEGHGLRLIVESRRGGGRRRGGSGRRPRHHRRGAVAAPRVIDRTGCAGLSVIPARRPAALRAGCRAGSVRSVDRPTTARHSRVLPEVAHRTASGADAGAVSMIDPHRAGSAVLVRSRVSGPGRRTHRLDGAGPGRRCGHKPVEALLDRRAADSLGQDALAGVCGRWYRVALPASSGAGSAWRSGRCARPGRALPTGSWRRSPPRAAGQRRRRSATRAERSGMASAGSAPGALRRPARVRRCPGSGTS